MSMNRGVSGIRATWMQAAAQLVNEQQLAAVEGQVVNQGVVIDSYGEVLSTKVGPEAVPTIAPLSQTINRRADPTFQLSDFMVPPMSGTTDQGGHNHTHTMTTSAAGPGRGADTVGRIYYAFITPLINRAYERLNFMLSAVSGTPKRMDVAVYTLNPDTKTLNRQVHVPDATAGVTFNEAVVTIEFPRWIAEQGSYVCIAWLQHGTGETRSLLGLQDTQRPLPTEIQYPHKISAQSSGTSYTSLPATIDGASATLVNFPGTWFTPYAELSEAVAIILRQFQDPFTSDSNQYIARPWVGLTEAQIRVQSEGWAGVPTTLVISTNPRAAIYETPLATDRVRIDGWALNNSSAVGSGAFSILAIRTTNNMSEGVGVFYSLDSVQIRTWSASTAEDIYSSSTVRASVGWSLGGARHFYAVWADGVLTVYDDDGTVLLSWADTVTAGSSRHKFTGIGFQRISGASSPRLDHWTARDLPPVAEEDEPEP